MKKALFVNEADLCASFLAYLPEGWTAYAETEGFDILLVRTSDGAQIGVEAKMTLNAKVLLQAAQGLYARHNGGTSGPDYRAALVPAGTASTEMIALARLIGVTVITCSNERMRREAAEKRALMYGEASHTRMYEWALKEQAKFSPELPEIDSHDWKNAWIDLLPETRCAVPDYVPDVKAGRPAPMQLSAWKIKAIKIYVLIELRGYATGMDFIELEINRQRFVQMGWLVPIPNPDDKRRSRYEACKGTLDLRRAHPVNFDQIKADFPKWATANMKEGIEVQE